MDNPKIIQEINGKLYSNRIGLHSDTCPFCKRKRSRSGDSRGEGFRKAGFQSHVFSCFTKALASMGYKEGTYDSDVLEFPLIEVENE